MKRFTIKQLIICCGLCVVCTTAGGLLLHYTGWHHAIYRSVMRPKPAPIVDKPAPIVEDPVDQNAYLVDRNALYQSLPEQYIRDKRLADQAKLLDAHEKDPVEFNRTYKFDYSGRTYVFDAVIDAPNMVRVGRFSDGGKWVSDPLNLRDGAVVYSFGVGKDISFETEMAGLYGCEVHAFDPTPSLQRDFANCQPGQNVGKGRFWYHPVGLGPTSLDPEKAEDLVLEGQKCQIKHLSELATEFCHTHVDVLKLDIEGGEMAALTEILASGTLEKLSVKQLLVEFHLWDDAHWNSFVHIIGLLRQHGYLLFRKEFNPFAADRCAEFAFLGPK